MAANFEQLKQTTLDFLEAVNKEDDSEIYSQDFIDKVKSSEEIKNYSSLQTLFYMEGLDDDFDDILIEFFGK